MENFGVCISLDARKETLQFYTNKESNDMLSFSFPSGHIVFELFQLETSVLSSVISALEEIRDQWDSIQLQELPERFQAIAKRFSNEWMQYLLLCLPLIPSYQYWNCNLNRLRINEAGRLTMQREQESHKNNLDWLLSHQARDRFLSEILNTTQREYSIVDSWRTCLFGTRNDTPDYTIEDYFASLYEDSNCPEYQRQGRPPIYNSQICMEPTKCPDRVKCSILAIKNAALQYLKSVFAYIYEIKKIRLELPAAYEKYINCGIFSDVDWLMEALNDTTPAIRYSTEIFQKQQNKEEISQKTKNIKNIRSKAINMKWNCRSISGLVATEIYIFGFQQSQPRKCKLCGQYFIPFSSKNIFCPNFNPQYNNPCNIIGPKLNWSKKLKEDIVQEQYLKHYRAYFNWKNNQDNLLTDYLNSHKRTMHTHEYHELDRELEKIKQDIKQHFENWTKKCSKIKKQFKQGSISEDDALRAIALPRPAQRSEKLRQWKDECRQEKGII